MKIPDIRYRSSQIFGDTNWHRVLDLSQMDLSESNPIGFVVGQQELPSIYSSVTKIKSPWLWRYGFNSYSSGRYYSTSTGSNGSTAITSLNVGVTSTTEYYVVGGLIVEEAYRTEGSVTKAAIETIRFGSYTSWYFTPSQSATPSAANRAIVCKFVANYEADLPDDMYTISGRNVIWNENHPIYILLYNKDVTPY